MKKGVIAVLLSGLLILSSISFSLSLSEYNLSYDDNGNLITGDGKYREYNEFNQLIKIYEGNSSNGTLLEEYIYHPTEDRVLVKKTNYIAGQSFDEVVFYFNENFVRYRTNVTGNDKIKDTYYVMDENGIVGEVTYNTTQLENNFSFMRRLFHHDDYKGSVSVITNSSGGVVEETFYDPFGAILEGGSVSRYSYEGKEFSPSTDDYDFHFRKYDPNLMVFTQPDSRINYPYNPQGINKYSFELNNPYKYVDPSGKYGVLIILGAISVIAIIGYIKGAIKSYNEGADIYEGATQEAGNILGETLTTERGIGEFALGLAGGEVFGETLSGISKTSSSLASRGSTSGSFNVGSKGAAAFRSIFGGTDDFISANRGISKEIVTKTRLQNINHILGKKHTDKWAKIVDDPKDWDQVKQVIEDVISTGKVEKAGFGFKATKEVKGVVVEVRYSIENGVGTAFVQ